MYIILREKLINMKYLNSPIDIKKFFFDMESQYFFASELLDFDVCKAEGHILFKRHRRKIRTSFNCITALFEKNSSWEFPAHYPDDYIVPFKLEFISENTVRILMVPKDVNGSPVISNAKSNIWENEENDDILYYTGKASVVITKNPFNITILDADKNILFSFNNFDNSPCLANYDPIPLSFVKSSETTDIYFGSSLSLKPNERIYGCGESFTSLNKRGQELFLYTEDPHGIETEGMYKPVPFFMSSRGYGVFYNTTTPLVLDVGKTGSLGNCAFLGDSVLDMFVFTGKPKDILYSYTELTGRASMPPVWSFGLWMSRITYYSKEEVLDVAKKLREYNIPCDVIHIDTGWFSKNWCCDFQFSEERFPDLEDMFSELKNSGFHVSLWQYPYFTPENPLYDYLIEKGYAVKGYNGGLPTPDAVLDFSNPEAVLWYQNKLSKLFELGVSAIKADFGEAAPVNGIYASGKTGFYEHNYYPYRYNKAVSDITELATNERIIWARSAWAGSQKYPVHWGGDSDNTDNAMQRTLNGGLSLGLCGFSFWSHDIGGFVKKSPQDLYERWLAFGMLTSHSRCHGAPPTEPWEYTPEFLEIFKKCTELKYSLMPYIIDEAEICCENGWPMLRTLFFEYPNDNGSWLIEDEYFFGEALLVAPIFESGTQERAVYLPSGNNWIDYQTKTEYEGGRWHTIQAGEIPIIIMAKKGSVIPHIPPALCTKELDFDKKFDVIF